MSITYKQICLSHKQKQIKSLHCLFAIVPTSLTPLTTLYDVLPFDRWNRRREKRVRIRADATET